ncbi:MAG: FAD-dependent oxidoreductase, partial [Actinomycetota bacterium]
MVPEDLPKFEGLAVGEAITLKARPFTVTTILSAECVAGEGELPFKVGAGYPAPVVDLRDSLGNFATLDYSDVTAEQPRPLVFIGEPVELGKLPTMRDPDHLVYYKPDGPGLLVGGYEPDTIAFGTEGIPEPFRRKLFDANYDRFAQLADLATMRTPVISKAGIRSLINGPIPYSADGDFVMCRTPELDNFYVATGFLYGIAAGGGAGKMMAEWMLEGRPSLDLWPLDVRRFSFHHTTKAFLGERM